VLYVQNTDALTAKHVNYSHVAYTQITDICGCCSSCALRAVGADFVLPLVTDAILLLLVCLIRLVQRG
jgi:7-cyano-7-deazaguanine synthase in queuosine biosynthesis